MGAKDVRVKAEDLKRFMQAVSEKAGFTAEGAENQADVLVWANLRGVDSHGVQRIAWYLELVDKGHMKPRPNIQIQKETPAALLIDADYAPGPVVTVMAMRKVIEKARTLGIGWAVIRNTLHQGAMGYYSLMAANEGMAGIAIVCNPPNMAPHGARASGVHNSPIAICVPGRKHRPLMGTEKAKVEAERASIPLDQTVIIGGTRHQKRAPSPRVKIEKHSIEPAPAPARNHLRTVVVSFLVVGALVVLGVLAVKDKAFFLRGILPKAHQGQKTEGTTVPPSAELEKTSQAGDISLTATSESPKSPALNEGNLGDGDAERSSFNIEAIVWSSHANKSCVLINGVEYRLGDSIEGRTIARIERDHVVMQSQEGESIIRLKFK